MARMPNNEYMPDYSNEKALHKKELASLNPENESGSSPLLISSHVVDWTEKYAKLATVDIDWSKYPGVQIDWQAEYEDDDDIWIPENRWTHEVVRKPVQISEDTYAVYLDADAYIKKLLKEYNDPKTDTKFVDAYIAFVTRTLYRYIEEDSENIIINNEEIIPQTYNWIQRWMPKYPCKIHYWSDESIEKATHLHIEPGTIDCSDENISRFSVPFMVKRSIKDSFAYIKHDSLIYYIRIEKV